MGNTKKFYNNKHNIKSYSSKFKDYDINKIKDELQIGEIPTEDIIKEMKADAELLAHNIELVIKDIPLLLKKGMAAFSNQIGMDKKSI